MNIRNRKQKKISKIRFGIIGCSSIAERSTIPAILQSKQAELHMIGSRSTLKAKKFAKKFSCSLYGDYDSVLNNKDIDAVYISLPIALQEKWIIRAVESKKHVLCEKSAVLSYNAAQNIIKICKKNQVRFMEGFSFLSHPQHAKVLHIIKNKSFGKKIVFLSRFLLPIKNTPSNFRFNKKLGGGSLNDVGCYIIAASKFIFGKNPLSVDCKLFRNTTDTVDTIGTIYITCQEKQVVLGVFGYGNSFQSQYEVIGTNGIVEVKHAYNIKKNKSAIIELKTKNKSIIYKIRPSNQFQYMIDDFCKTISKKYTATNYEREFLMQAKIMESARISSSENRIVNLKEI